MRKTSLVVSRDVDIINGPGQSIRCYHEIRLQVVAEALLRQTDILTTKQLSDCVVEANSLPRLLLSTGKTGKRQGTGSCILLDHMTLALRLSDRNHSRYIMNSMMKGTSHAHGRFVCLRSSMSLTRISNLMNLGQLWTGRYLTRTRLSIDLQQHQKGHKS